MKTAKRSREPAVGEREPLVYAGFGSRVGAIAIDLTVALVWTLVFLPLYRAALPDPEVFGPITVFELLVGAAFWSYLVIATAVSGGTLGKHALRLRVVSAGFERPDWLTVVLREVVGRVIVAASVGLGYVWVGVDPRKQGWHDKIADTFVIKRVRPIEARDPWSEESPPADDA
jgi:uncharacterized RDD family membrane protein YckC